MIKNLKKYFLYLIAIGASISFLLFFIACTWIGYEVRATCDLAQSNYSGDCVEAMSSLVDDESMPFALRNSAVWSLGQLGDSRALTSLESHYTGEIPDREPLDEVLSQYELRKAINLAKGGVNISAPFWRYSLAK